MHVQEAVACGCLPILPTSGPTDDFIPPRYRNRELTSIGRLLNIQDSGVFAMKPGDATTLMSTHTFIMSQLDKI